MKEEHGTPEQETDQKREESVEHTIRDTTEKLWDRTRKTFQSATVLANQYKKIVQKKIDLAAVHKKISNVHADLGKLVDEKREDIGQDILAAPEIIEALQHLDQLKTDAVVLLQEIEAIKKEQEDESAPAGDETH